MAAGRRASRRHHGARASRATDRRSGPLGLPAGAARCPFRAQPRIAAAHDHRGHGGRPVHPGGDAGTIGLADQSRPGTTHHGPADPGVCRRSSSGTPSRPAPPDVGRRRPGRGVTSGAALSDRCRTSSRTPPRPASGPQSPRQRGPRSPLRRVGLDHRAGWTGYIAGRFRDMERDNAALLGGDVTLRYGWQDVTDRPCAVAREVAALLIRRGWTGLPTRCRRCALATDADLGSA